MLRGLKTYRYFGWHPNDSLYSKPWESNKEEHSIAKWPPHLVLEHCLSFYNMLH